jgi:hypothetical protein
MIRSVRGSQEKGRRGALFFFVHKNQRCSRSPLLLRKWGRQGVLFAARCCFERGRGIAHDSHAQEEGRKGAPEYVSPSPHLPVNPGRLPNPAASLQHPDATMNAPDRRSIPCNSHVAHFHSTG